MAPRGDLKLKKDEEIGLAIGIVLAVGLLAGLAYWIWRKRRQNQVGTDQTLNTIPHLKNSRSKEADEGSGNGSPPVELGTASNIPEMQSLANTAEMESPVSRPGELYRDKELELESPVSQKSDGKGYQLLRSAVRLGDMKDTSPVSSESAKNSSCMSPIVEEPSPLSLKKLRDPPLPAPVHELA